MMNVSYPYDRQTLVTLWASVEYADVMYGWYDPDSKNFRKDNYSLYRNEGARIGGLYKNNTPFATFDVLMDGDVRVKSFSPAHNFDVIIKREDYAGDQSVEAGVMFLKPIHLLNAIGAKNLGMNEKVFASGEDWPINDSNTIKLLTDFYEGKPINGSKVKAKCYDTDKQGRSVRKNLEMLSTTCVGRWIDGEGKVHLYVVDLDSHYGDDHHLIAIEVSKFGIFPKWKYIAQLMDLAIQGKNKPIETYLTHFGMERSQREEKAVIAYLNERNGRDNKDLVDYNIQNTSVGDSVCVEKLTA